MNNLTMEQIADHLGVSKSTVSRVVSGKGRISSYTRERVLSYIKANNYHMNSVARGLATAKSYNLGLVIPSIDTVSDAYPVNSIMQGVLDVVEAHNFNLIVTTVKEGNESEIISLVESGKVDGLLLYSSLAQKSVIEGLQQVEFPYVVIGRVLNQSSIQIDFNYRLACKELLQIIVDMGYTKIIIIAENMKDRINTTNFTQMAGFNEAFEELAMNMSAEYIYCDWSSALQIFIEGKVNAIVYLQFDAKELGRTACKILFDLLEHKQVQSETLTGYEIRFKI